MAANNEQTNKQHQEINDNSDDYRNLTKECNMAGWRQSIVVGNVGKVEDLRYTSAGKAVLNFTVAVSEVWGSGDQRQEKTVWHRIALWSQLAESLAPYIVKGKQVMCVGTLDAHAYTDNAGQPAASLEMTAREVRLLGSKGDGADSEYAPSPTDSKDTPF